MSETVIDKDVAGKMKEYIKKYPDFPIYTIPGIPEFISIPFEEMNKQERKAIDDQCKGW